jgi:hypothetical protein
MNRPRLRNFWQKRGADVGVISAISIFFVLFFWQTIFKGDIIIGGDPLVYSYPLRMIAWESIRNGVLPLWTPLIFSGYPLLSMAQLALVSGYLGISLLTRTLGGTVYYSCALSTVPDLYLRVCTRSGTFQAGITTRRTKFRLWWIDVQFDRDEWDVI